jgi:hypothetical protein
LRPISRADGLPILMKENLTMLPAIREELGHGYTHFIE